MNMIVCGEQCKHQREGYCCLEGESRITGAIKSPCWYFYPNEKNTVTNSKTDYSNDSGENI
ncbi:hypothetical protein FACS1894120_3200 [Clostridia bacterium]|nr:hypothetical protein FACS1894120_3200 [Clostridia bacterium]